MSFTVVAAGDPILASVALGNWRHINYGSDLLPVNSSGVSIDDTLNLGSSTKRWSHIWGMEQTLSNQPRAVVQQVTSDQSFPVTTLTSLTFDTEAVDTDAMVDIGGNPTRITIKTAGIYLVKFSYYTDVLGAGAGYMTATIRVNNTTDLQTELQPVVPSSQNGCSCAWIGALAVNDYLQFNVYRTGGGSGSQFIVKGAEKFQAMAVKLF